MPTIPILERIATALDSALLMAIVPSHHVVIGFRDLVRARATVG